MKNSIVIFLAACILFLAAGKTLILINYAVNKEYISKNLCENRNKPQMNCNGKCHLKKELQKEEKKENSPFNNLKEKIEIQLFHNFCVNISPIENYSESSFLEQSVTHYLCAYAGTIFQPPKA